MPSEFSPGGGRARMSKAQIAKLLKEQEEARRIAEEKLAEAKKSEEWKKEQEILNSLKNALEDDKLITSGGSIDVPLKHINKQKKLSLWEKIITWFN